MRLIWNQLTDHIKKIKNNSPFKIDFMKNNSRTIEHMHVQLIQIINRWHYKLFSISFLKLNSLGKLYIITHSINLFLGNKLYLLINYYEKKLKTADA